MIYLLKRGEPFVYHSFEEALKNADIGDEIIEGLSDKFFVYVVPNYGLMKSIEDEIKSMGEYTERRKILEMRLKVMTTKALEFEERSKKCQK